MNRACQRAGGKGGAWDVTHRHLCKQGDETLLGLQVLKMMQRAKWGRRHNSYHKSECFAGYRSFTCQNICNLHSTLLRNRRVK